MDRAEVPYEFLHPFSVVTAWEVAAVLAGAFIGWALARYRWRIEGLLGYVGLLCLLGGYLSYSLTVSIPQVPAEQRWLSYILLIAESGGLGLFFLFSLYSLDAATRKRWNRVPPLPPFDPDNCPKVAFQVPVFNEPREMVEQTILHLVNQDYPKSRFMVIVCDDSTDPAARTGLEKFCIEVGAVYQPRPGRGGYKAGALNYATKQLPADVELIAVVDADYWVDADFLKSNVGHFAEPKLGFVQTPQDYRNIHESFLTRQYKRAETFFYHAIMPSRNEQNAIMFCGTMGILRRTALEEAGGFAENQICEDAELSVRLSVRGWQSLYVNRSYGKGLVPAVFETYQKQFHRWAFGNVRIFLTRTWMILRSRMRRRQKFDFIVSNLHWFDGFFIVAIAFVLFCLGLGPLFGVEMTTHHQRELALLGLIPVVLVIDSTLRLLIVLRRTGKVRLWDAFLVQGLWFSIKLTNLRAVIRCLLGFRTPFTRTSKKVEHRLSRTRAFGRAIRITKTETTIGLAMIAVAALNVKWAIQVGPVGPLAFLASWLILFALFFLCAPIYAYLSYRTLKPMQYDGLTRTGMPEQSRATLPRFVPVPRAFTESATPVSAQADTGAVPTPA